jgi:putative transposase
METNALAERLRFVGDYESGQWTMSELCERFGISRPTGYKWIGRSRAPDGCLAELSRAPHPARTGPRRASRTL